MTETQTTIVKAQPIEFRIVEEPPETMTIPFNTFVHIAPVYADRELFHAFVCVDTLGDLTEDQWWAKYDDFKRWGREAVIQMEDSRDLHATQRDALL